MSEAIQWAKLTPKERDYLVAEIVMGWWEKECPGELMECSGGWQCSACERSGDWGEDGFHESYVSHPASPPHYTQCPVALEVLETFPEVTIHYLKDPAIGGRCRVIIQNAGYCYSVARDSLSEAICIASLMAHGMDVQV